MASPMISRPAVHESPRGAQEPRIRSVPDYVSSAGREAIELCALAGLHLDPWEQLVIWDMLGERADGKWACYEFGLVVPRQNGKGSCLEARELVGLFLLGELLLIHSAHEQATSSEHFRRLLTLIEGVPEFDRRVLKAPKGKGSEAIELRGGQRIFFKTRTLDGGRGLTGNFVALDEAMKLRQATIAALVPTMAAQSITGNPQLVYSGSSVDQEKDEHGVVLARVRERAMSATPGRLGFHEYSCEGDDPGAVPESVAGDPEMWAQANPGLGIRISLEYIADERGALDPRSFAVERLGIGDWPDTSEDGGRVISAEAWGAVSCADPAQSITGPRTFAVDVAPNETHGSIAVSGLRPDGLWHVAVVEHKTGAGWMFEKVKALLAKFPDARVVADHRGPAAVLVGDLKDAALISDDDLTSSAEYAQACAAFFNAVIEKRLRYPVPQPELDSALATARTKPLEDSWKWSRKNSTSADITPLIAATLALWGARNGESQFTNVLYASDHEPAKPDEPEVGMKRPLIITQEMVTTCFACSQGGVCPVHG